MIFESWNSWIPYEGTLWWWLMTIQLNFCLFVSILTNEKLSNKKNCPQNDDIDLFNLLLISIMVLKMVKITFFLHAYTTQITNGIFFHSDSCVHHKHTHTLYTVHLVDMDFFLISGVNFFLVVQFVIFIFSLVSSLFVKNRILDKFSRQTEYICVFWFEIMILLIPYIQFHWFWKYQIDGN